jgi:hypothetical protein
MIGAPPLQLRLLPLLVPPELLERRVERHGVLGGDDVSERPGDCLVRRLLLRRVARHVERHGVLGMEFSAGTTSLNSLEGAAGRAPPTAAVVAHGRRGAIVRGELAFVPSPEERWWLARRAVGRDI